MKLQIILQNNFPNVRTSGFLIPEAMIAFSLMTLFLISALVLSATMQKLRETGVKSLEDVKKSINNADYFLAHHAFASTTRFSETPYGNDTRQFEIGPLTILSSDTQVGWGRDSCNPRIAFNEQQQNIHLYSQGVDLGSGNVSTDLEARNGFVYLTADSATASDPDIYIVDARNPTSSHIISSLDTGPGLSRIEVAGPYIFASNTGGTNQLQIIDISNRSSPILRSKFKLPLPFASSTAPAATAIFYSKGLVYIGTKKWDGNEFNVIDVSNPATPKYLGGFKTDTLINDIYVRDGLAFVAASDQGQMRILDVRNPLAISQIESFSPTGWETQEGKSLSYFEGKLSLGRTTGGFNVLLNHELFSFSTTSPLATAFSHDIPGGVYGIVMQPETLFVATRLVNKEFQIWKRDLSAKIFEYPLGFFPQAMTCDGNAFYFASGDRKGFAVLLSN